MRKQLLCFAALLAASLASFTLCAQSWNITGNSNATTSSKLGTTNNVPLRLFTNNAEQVRIDASGKVGIGTTNLIGKFTVFNNGSTPATSWINAGAPLFVGFGESTVGNADHILSMASGTYNARGVFIGRRARGTLASPSAVQNADYLASILASGYDGSAFQNPATIDFFVDGTPTSGNVPARISLVTGTNSGNRAERLKVGSTGNIDFNNGQLYVQQSTGNVGIGATDLSYKLNVNGTIRAKEIRVESGWADYVFDKSYKLPSLDNVARYIEQNKHLPGIASAKEIQQNGLNVAEMQTKMMEKIEELTLYVIELQKQIAELKKASSKWLISADEQVL